MNKSKALAGARRRGWERQFPLGSSTSDLGRYIYSQSMVSDDDFLYISGAIHSDRFEGLTFTNISSTRDTFLWKVRKDNGMTEWFKLFNDNTNNRDGVASGILCTEYNKCAEMAISDNYVFMEVISKLSGVNSLSVLRVRKSDGYAEEGLKFSSATSIGGVLVHNNRLVSRHKDSSGNVEFTSFLLDDFSTSSVHSTTITHRPLHHFNPIVYGDDIVMVYGVYSDSGSNIEVLKVNHSSSGVLSAEHVSLHSMSGACGVTNIQEIAPKRFIVMVTDYNTSHESGFLDFELDSSWDITSPHETQLNTNKNWFIGTILSFKNKKLRCQISVPATFNELGFSLEYPETKYAVIDIEYDFDWNTGLLTASKINKSFEVPLISTSSGDMLDYIDFSICVDEDTAYMAHISNGMLPTRYRYTDADQPSDWYEASIIKLPLS